MIRYRWELLLQNTPLVLKYCPKCGCQTAYESSGNFRVNANHNHLDVWLIYLCQKCSCSWNMDIISRVEKKAIDKDLYVKFLENDPELADHYAYDSNTHFKNKVVMDYNSLLYEIKGDNISLPDLKEAVEIEILCKYALNLRLDKVLSRQLQVSRNELRRLEEEKRILVEGYSSVLKAKVKNGLRINILP